MVKGDLSYRKYEFLHLFNVIGSRTSSVVFIPSKKGRLCAVGACENVIIWNLRSGEKHRTLTFATNGEKHCVVRLALRPGSQQLAVGYLDGTIRVFDVTNGDLLITFNGHKSGVTCLDFHSSGLLISGALDTAVIVWDLVAETGLYRLKGHKGPISQVALLKEKNLIITSSKDATVKFWDLESQHCFKTLVGMEGEVKDFALVRNQRRLLMLSGSNPHQMDVYDITFYDEINEADGHSAILPEKKLRLEDGTTADDEGDLHILKCEKVGSLQTGLCISITADPTGRLLICHGVKSHCQVFMVLSPTELQKKRTKKQKKANLKRQLQTESDVVPGVQLTLEDEFRLLTKTTGIFPAGIRSLDIVIEPAGTAQVVCLCSNNSLTMVNISLTDTITRGSMLEALGHRADVRTVAFSSDDIGILTAGASEVKVWNRASLQCIRTMPCKDPLCSLFAPGDQYAIVGTKDGTLNIFNLASSSVESIDAHSGAVKAITMSPDKKFVATGSSANEVKFWRFELTTKDDNGKELSLELHLTFELDYNVNCVKYSPKSRYVGIALNEAGTNVRIFRANDMRMVHKLYGHAFPVTCMDFSYDDELLVTGSLDKKIKIWGMDHGDTHKSLLAEQECIMGIQFVPKTHYFFSAGQDGTLKQWDADNFQRICTLQGHHLMIRALAISASGQFVVSASQDRSVRLWQRTKEIINLVEEREKEADKEDEESMVHDGETVVPGEADAETAIAGKKTIQSIKSTEKLREAVDLYRVEAEKLGHYEEACKATRKQLKKPEPEDILKAYNLSGLDYVRKVIREIKANDLEDVLLSLPFSYVSSLLPILVKFYDFAEDVDRADKCTNFLLRIHHNQLLISSELYHTTLQLQKLKLGKTSAHRDMVGFNLAGLQFLQQKLAERDHVDIFQPFRPPKKKRK